MKKSYLQHAHIRLRNVEPEDLEFIYQVENDPELWEVSQTSVPFSRYVLKQYLENSRCDLFADRQLRLMIESRKTGEIAGMIDLADFEPMHNRAAAGIMVSTDYRHQGIGHEALELLCRYGSEHLHLNQLYAYIPADNEYSLKLFASCGFEWSGVLKEWLRSGKRYKDAVLVQKLFS